MVRRSDEGEAQRRRWTFYEAINPSAVKHPKKAKDRRMIRPVRALGSWGFNDGQEIVRSIQESDPFPLAKRIPFPPGKILKGKGTALPDPLGNLAVDPDLPCDVDTIFQGDDAPANGFHLYPPG